MCLEKTETNIVNTQVSLQPCQSNKDGICPFAQQIIAEWLPAAFQEPLPFHSFQLVAAALFCEVR